VFPPVAKPTLLNVFRAANATVDPKDSERQGAKTPT
jgi:hypothetical protein